MPFSRTYTLGLVRNKIQLITIEASITAGLPETTLVGLPNTEVREVRDRIRAAIVNSGKAWPSTGLTIKLSPARAPARPSSLDLAIAIAVLAAAGDIPDYKLGAALFVAELGLDGQLRSTSDVPEVLAAIREARLPDLSESERYMFVAATQHALPTSEARKMSSRSAVSIVAADHLRDVADWLQGMSLQRLHGCESLAPGVLTATLWHPLRLAGSNHGVSGPSQEAHAPYNALASRSTSP